MVYVIVRLLIWKQGNFNYNGRTLRYEDKENSVENFEKEYLGFTVQTVIM